jgi:hypothetical protein
MILDPAQREPLATAFSGLHGGKVNTFWRARIAEGRFIEITKVIGIHVVDPATGRTIMATGWLGAEWQEAYLDDPAAIETVPLGEYAAVMRELALREATAGHWLKSAKRAFNYLRTIGNLEGMAAVAPVFQTNEARLNQRAAELETISSALRPDRPTRVLTLDVAQARLREAAADIESTLPPVGAPPADSRENLAARLRTLANELESVDATPTGPLRPNARQRGELDRIVGPIGNAINLSLEQRVRDVIDTYVR